MNKDAGNAVCGSKSEIPQQLDRLRASLESLDKALENLRDKTGTLRRQVPSEGCGKQICPDPDVMCEIASEMGIVADGVFSKA